MEHEDVMAKIQNFSYNRERLREVHAQLESMTYKTTATYGNLAASMSTGFSSKVEKYGNRSYELHKKEAKLKRKLDEIVKLIQYSGLDNREKALMWWLANNGKLQGFARRQRIGKFNVYKIRDRAVKKIIAAYKTQNVR